MEYFYVTNSMPFTIASNYYLIISIFIYRIRLVSLTKERGWIHLKNIQWMDDQLKSRIMIKLKKVL